MRILGLLMLFFLAPIVSAETVPLILEIEEAKCALGMLIFAQKEIQLGETISYVNNFTVKRKDFVIQYWIEHEDGTIAKNPRNTTNTDVKKFTPKNAGIFYLKNKLISVDCIDTTSDDNTSSFSVIVHGDVHETNISVDLESKQQQESKKNPLILSNEEPTIKEAKVVYESSSITSKRLIIWVIVAVVGVLGALLVWRR